MYNLFNSQLAIQSTGEVENRKIHNTVNKNKGDGYTCFPNINIHNFMSHELL